MAIMSFDFYGLTIRIQSENQSLVDEIERDFTYFKSIEEEGEIRIEMNLMPPRYEGLPELPAQFITPRNVCYKDNTRTIIDYSGKALCIQRHLRCRGF